MVQFRATKIPTILSVITSIGNAFLLFPPTENITRADEKGLIEQDIRWTSQQVFESSTGSRGEREEAKAIDVNSAFGLCTVGTSE